MVALALDNANVTPKLDVVNFHHFFFSLSFDDIMLILATRACQTFFVYFFPRTKVHRTHLGLAL